MKGFRLPLIMLGILVLIGGAIVVLRFVLGHAKDEVAVNAQIVNGTMYDGPSVDVELDPSQVIPAPAIIEAPATAKIDDAAIADASAQAAMNCAVSSVKNLAISDWNTRGTVSAQADGDTCGQALVRLLVRDGADKIVFTMTAPARDFGVAPDADGTSLKDAIEKTLPQSSTHANSFPEWKNNDTKPFGTEFDQATYEKLRAEDVPIICLKLPSAPQTCIAENPKDGMYHTFVRG